MTAYLRQLVEVRSQLAEEICQYCTRLVEKLEGTPWFREGQRIRASDLAVPVRVFKESTRLERSRFEGERAEHEASRDYLDATQAALYEDATLGEGERKQEVPWLQEREQVRRAV